MTVSTDTIVNWTPVEGSPGPSDWSQGPPGSTGATGAAGPPGAKGDKGDPGIQGMPGPSSVGATGATGATGPQGNTGATGPAGATGAASTVPGPAGPAGAPMLWRGAWSSGTTYLFMDAVSYNGSSYVATTTVASGGANPSINGSWQTVAVKGDTGATGATGATGNTGSTGATGSVAAAGAGTAAAPSISFAGDPNTGFYNVTGDYIGVSTGGVLRWAFTSSGHYHPELDNAYDLGLSNQRPRNLYLAGTATVGGDLTLSASAGQSQVVATSGSMRIGPTAAQRLLFQTNGTYRWNVMYDTGHFFPWVDNTYDLGDPSLRPRNLYLAGTATVPVLDAPLHQTTGNVVEQRNGTSPQRFDIFNTYSSAGANQEALIFRWSSNSAKIEVNNAGTGSPRDLYIGPISASELYFQTSNIGRWRVSSAGHLTAFWGQDNVNDIGADNLRPRNLYLAGTANINAAMVGPGTSVNLPGYLKIQGANATVSLWPRDSGVNNYDWYVMADGLHLWSTSLGNDAVLFSPTGNPSFNGTALTTKQTVSGSRAANAALASLLTALSNIGLITNSSTA
jgi:hypothetical protein